MIVSPTVVGILIGSSIAFIGGIANVIVNAIVQIKTANLTREHEERKHYREMLMNVALEYWKSEYPDAPPSRPSLEEYIVRMNVFYEHFVEENFDRSKRQAKRDAYDVIIKARKDVKAKENQTNGAT